MRFSALFLVTFFCCILLRAEQPAAPAKLKNFHPSYTSIENSQWIVIFKNDYLEIFDRKTKLLDKRIKCVDSSNYNFAPSVILTAADEKNNSIPNKIITVDLEEGNAYLTNIISAETIQINDKTISGSPDRDSFKSSYGNLYYTYSPVSGENFEYTGVINYSSYL